MKRSTTTRVASSHARWVAVLLLGAGVAQASPAVVLPPTTRAASVARRIVYNGVDMQATVFQSQWSQQRVVDFYRQRWDKQVSIDDLQASKIVGHFDGEDFITVEVASDGSGSRGTIGVVRLPPKAAPRPELGQGLPRPFGAKVVNDIAYPDDRPPARTVLMIDSLSPDQNGSYFRSRLLANGWSDANANHCAYGAPHCVFEFQRGKSKLMLVCQRARGRSEVLINVLDPKAD